MLIFVYFYFKNNGLLAQIKLYFNIKLFLILKKINKLYIRSHIFKFCNYDVIAQF